MNWISHSKYELLENEGYAFKCIQTNACITNTGGWTWGDLETHTHLPGSHISIYITQKHTVTQMTHILYRGNVIHGGLLLGRVPCSLFLPRAARNICRSTEEPSGGERTGLTAMMAPRIPALPPQPVLLPSNRLKTMTFSWQIQSRMLHV